MHNVFLIQIQDYKTSLDEIQYNFSELTNLVYTYGGLVIVKTLQRKNHPDYNTYIGSGKIQEIIIQMKELWADLLIVGNILKPAQIYKLNEKLKSENIVARDRVDLILKIFAKHATSIESKLQIELASIKHMGPRIFGMGMELSRQWGWSKLSRWLGETNTEIMQRHLWDKEYDIRQKLKKYQNTRSLHRANRIRKWLMTVGIVWYTNAGKSSLMNTLCNKWVLVEDKLFATLWTAVGRLSIEISEWIYRTILVNDTIGFISDLPPGLIEAFQSTLEDSIQSQILLHVVDAHDNHIKQKVKVVQDILKEIWSTQPILYVFTKTDLVTTEQLIELKLEYNYLLPCWISTHTNHGIDELKKKILSFDF